MSERHGVQGEQTGDEKRGTLKRRGLIAGAAALVATALASKASMEEVSAANGGPVLLGGDTSGSGAPQQAGALTWIATTAALTASPAFRATNNFGVPDNLGDGVAGFTTSRNNAGVFGRNNDLDGVGIFGEAPNGTGAFGDSSSGSGVAGSSSTGIGVFGQSDTVNSSIGVKGTSVKGFGVYGTSGGGPGVFGTTTAAQNAGLAGLVSTAGTAAFAGTATVPGAFAGFFTGDVFVNGNFTVQDPTKKHGAIQSPNDPAGTLRVLYSMESPESWLEDFGQVKFANGTADVSLAPDFAAVVHTDDYHVFLTETDGNHHLTVHKKTATGFTIQADTEVAALKGKVTADLSGSVSYRVVAKPQSPNKAERLAKFTVPKINVPKALDTQPTIPKPRKTRT